MSSLITYFPAVKRICFAFLFQIFILFVCAQCPSAPAVYQQVLDLEKNDSATDLAKLKKILFFKKQFEECHLEKDSVYARILHRAGTFEYAVNHNNLTASIINNTLEAARINTSKGKAASERSGVNSYYNLACYYYSISYYDKALPYFDSVIHYNQTYLSQQLLTDEALFRKAIIYGIKRDYEKYKETSTLGIAAAIKDNDSFRVAKFYYFRAQGYCNQAVWKQAKQDIDTGIHYAAAIKSTQVLADCFKLKAMAYAGEKDYFNAESFFQKTLQLRIKDENASDLVTDYLDIGNYYLKDRGNIKTAISSYEKMASLCRSLKDNITLSQAYTSIAEANFRKGDLKAARYNDSLAASSLSQASPKNIFENAPASQLFSVDNKDELLVFMNNKIELLLLLYKQSLQPIYLRACLTAALVMDTLVTKTRHEQFGEQSKLYWRNKTRDYFKNAFEACYLSRNDSLAFYFMERSRAVVLYDKINELGATAHLSSDESRKEEQYQIKLIELKQRLSEASPASGEYNKIQLVYFQTKDDFENYTQSLEKTNPVYYQYKYEDNTPSLSDLQKFLSRNQQNFIYYFISDSATYALSIESNKTNFIKISAKDFDTRELSQFVSLCSNKQGLNNNYKTFASLSQNIYNNLFKSLQLPKGNIAVCTDNFFIPFEALCRDDKGKNFLLYDYNFSYVYSARSLMKSFTGHKASGDFIGFAPVSFSSYLQVFPLLHSSSAVADVAGYYRDHTLFTQKQATRSNFFNEAAKYSVVTIFSHAQADTTDKEPVMYMQDSLIHLSELGMLRNPAIQFVLLSACQTNIGRNATGEGIYSLARGFAAAGVPSVSATLWKADEEAVYKISAKFNEHLSKGMNKSEALRKAKIWYLQNSNREHALPYYWANMVMIGSSQPLMITQSNHIWYWILSSVVFITVCVAALFILNYWKKNYRKSNPDFQNINNKV